MGQARNSKAAIIEKTGEYGTVKLVRIQRNDLRNVQATVGELPFCWESKEKLACQVSDQMMRHMFEQEGADANSQIFNVGVWRDYYLEVTDESGIRRYGFRVVDGKKSYDRCAYGDTVVMDGVAAGIARAIITGVSLSQYARAFGKGADKTVDAGMGVCFTQNKMAQMTHDFKTAAHTLAMKEVFSYID